MTEAQLRVVASELFREMGMEDSPDSLDFFQKNAENGSSSEWKKCLKSPSTRIARRVSSDGTALVHLRKKYSTGLVSDQGQATRSIKASDIEVSPVHGRSRKFSPSLKQKSRFGYVSSTAKVADSASVSKDSSETKPTTSCYSPEESSKSKGMFKMKRSLGKSSSVAAPVVASHTIKGVGPSKLPTSVSAGNICAVRPLGKSASSGTIPSTRSSADAPPAAKTTTTATSNDDNKQSSSNGSSGSGLAAKRDQGNRSPPTGGTQSSIPKPGTLPTHNRSGSHGSAIPFAARSTKREAPGTSAGIDATGKKARSISVVHNGIDTNKLSGVNMRSLTRTRGVDETSTPERKTSDSSSGAADKRQSFTPTPSQQAAGVGGGTSSTGSKSNSGRNVANGMSVTPAESSSGTAPARSNSGSSTQVLYARKPSFKLIPMSSSSHRIMHTVQDGGPPRRLTSRASQPVLPVVSNTSATAATASAQQNTCGSSNNSSIPRPAHGKAAKETVVLRHANEVPTPQALDGLENQNGGYDSLPVKEKRSKETEETDSMNLNSLQGQTRGEYDRLSPPVQNIQSPSKQGDEPFYDTIQNAERVRDCSATKERKTSGNTKTESHSSVRLNVSSANTAAEGKRSTSSDPIAPPLPSNMTRSVSNQITNGISATSSSGGLTSANKVLAEPSKSKLPIARKLSRESKTEKEPQGSKKTTLDKNDFGFQRKPSGGRRGPQNIPRYTSKSGDTYSLVSKSKSPVQFQQPAATTSASVGTMEEPNRTTAKMNVGVKFPRSTTAPSITKDVEDRAAAASFAGANNNNHTHHNHHHHHHVQHAHRPLQVSLSADSSTSAARTTPISFNVQALSSESVGGDSMRSATSAASSELEIPTDETSAEREKGTDKRGGLVPKGGVAMMASVERRAKLAINWSEQSLDRNMPTMITSTVEALGNLVEAISSPPGNSPEDGSGDEGGLKMRWYQAVDGEDSPGGLCVSMSPVSSATTPSTSATSPTSLAKLERSGTYSPRDTSSPVDKVQQKTEVNCSREVRDVSKSSSKSQKEFKGQKNAGKGNKMDEEVTPSVPARTVSLSDKLQLQRGVVSGSSHLEMENKTVGTSTSHTDGAVMSRIPPRRNTVGARPVNSSTAPPLPPKSKPVKPPAPPPPTTDDAVPQSDFKSGIPAAGNKFGFSSSNSRPLSTNRLGNNSSRNSSGIRPPGVNKSHVQTRSSSDQRPKREKPKGDREWQAPAVIASRTLTSKKMEPPNPLNHDYAVLEAPSDHDYAILDPEYHEEFYGYCALCTEPIIGMENGCLALDKTYHTKCFKCSKCGASLSEKNFYFSHGKLICEKDMKVTLEQCRKCQRRIQDRVIKALGSSYHPDCFKCTVCGKCLDGVHYTCDGKMKLFCIEDYHKVYAPKCAVCDKSILPCNGQKKSLQVLAMNKSYHIQCYKCEQCHRQLASWTGGGEKCYPLNGHLLCRTCHSTRARRSDSSYTTPSPTSAETIIC